jgi:asparagine synthase (glutamine-hydrolysing)
MCGITGQYQFDRNQRIDEACLNRSLSTLKRRGPDGQKTEILPGVGLGHSRLSIIDLSAAADQPMWAHNRYCMVFNGEVFNFKSLAQELGISSKSDSEVLLESYIRWGENCLNKLNGFFAFAIYDKEKHSLFAARDRFGIKPFLYAQDNHSFYFASELKALLEYPIERDLSSTALNAFFHLSYVPGEQGIFEGIKRLLPGHFLKIHGSRMEIKKYYSILDKISDLGFEEAKENLQALVDQAVDNWLFSDAPLGAFLSGGVDSSIVVALAAQKVKHLKTFSVTFPESKFHNEGPFAKAVAEKYATDHTEIPLSTENIYSSVDQVLDYLDEPFADSSAIPTFALSQSVGKEVKVSLSGDGADEVFGGYEKHRAEVLAQNWQGLVWPAKAMLPLIRNLPQSRDGTFRNLVRKSDRMLSGISLSNSERYLQWCSFNSNEAIKSLLIKNSPAWRDQLAPSFSKDGINTTLFRDMMMVLPNDMLTKVDMMSMANSLEVRPVFLDHRVVDFAFSLPGHFKVTNRHKKLILVETFKHLLPEQVYNRPKHGFTVELMPFFKNKFWGPINDLYLNDHLIKEQGLFDLKTIQNLKNQIKNGSAKDIQSLVWSLITFQNFWLKFKARGPQ